MKAEARFLSRHSGKNLILTFPQLPPHLDRSADERRGERGCHEERAALSVWLPSTVKEQILQQDPAAAGSKQAETADSVNHSFTPSKIWWTRQGAG